jgi:hypothetical protein
MLTTGGRLARPITATEPLDGLREAPTLAAVAGLAGHDTSGAEDRALFLPGLPSGARLGPATFTANSGKTAKHNVDAAAFTSKVVP